MRVYSVEELAPDLTERFAKYLDALGYAADIERLYWIPIPAEHLLPIQQEHLASCGEYAMALELMDNAVRLELLVRARGRLRCECIAYAAPETERLMMDWVDTQLAALAQPPA